MALCDDLRLVSAELDEECEDTRPCGDGDTIGGALSTLSKGEQQIKVLSLATPSSSGHGALMAGSILD